MAATVIFGLLGALSLIPLAKDLFPESDKDATTVRVTLGFPAEKDVESLSGNIPGVALWDDFGHPIGTTFSSGKVRPAGSFTDIKVNPNPGVGNLGATYMSITHGGDDAICISGVTVTFPSGQTTAWAGNTAALCPEIGAKLTFSSEGFSGATDTTNSSICVWIDGDDSNGILHQGIGIRLPDFGGLVSPAQADAYNETSALMCDSGPRFRMYESLRTEEPILVYEVPPTEASNGTDADPGQIIGNPGKFADIDMVALRKACGGKYDPRVQHCDLLPPTVQPGGHIAKRAERLDHARYRSRPRRHQQQQNDSSSQSVSAHNSTATGLSSHDGSPRYVNTTTPKRKPRFHDHCIISSRGHSAKYLCNHPNSYGPSFASTTEGLFCDLVTKKLHPICESAAADGKALLVQEVDVSACFDLSTQRLRSPVVAPTRFNLHTEALSGGAATVVRNFTQVAYWS